MNETRTNALLMALQDQRDAALRDHALLYADLVELRLENKALRKKIEELEAQCTPVQNEEKTS